MQQQGLTARAHDRILKSPAPSPTLGGEPDIARQAHRRGIPVTAPSTGSYWHSPGYWSTAPIFCASSFVMQRSYP